jgi:hypothetical protein
MTMSATLPAAGRRNRGRVVVRTHGGLGNQLFQVFYARLLAAARQVDYVEIHDANYPHKFQRSPALSAPSGRADPVQAAVSSARIPKVLQRLGCGQSEVFGLFSDRYADGYFQRTDQYLAFPPAAIRAEIDRMRSELGIEPEAAKDTRHLYHLRLGDFFNDPEKALDHACERVKDLVPGSVIITNQEDIFQEPRISQALVDACCTLQPSGDFSAEQVIRLMAGFAVIVTNDSTLAFWASVLGNCQTAFQNARLAELHEFLFKIANN